MQTDVGSDEKLMSPRRSPRKSEQSKGEVTVKISYVSLSQHC